MSLGLGKPRQPLSTATKHRPRSLVHQGALTGVLRNPSRPSTEDGSSAATCEGLKLFPERVLASNRASPSARPRIPSGPQSVLSRLYNTAAQSSQGEIHTPQPQASLIPSWMTSSATHHPSLLCPGPLGDSLVSDCHHMLVSASPHALQAVRGPGMGLQEVLRAYWLEGCTMPGTALPLVALAGQKCPCLAETKRVPCGAACRSWASCCEGLELLSQGWEPQLATPSWWPWAGALAPCLPLINSSEYNAVPAGNTYRVLALRDRSCISPISQKRKLRLRGLRELPDITQLSMGRC